MTLMATDYRILTANWAHDQAQLIDLRTRVFVDEQHVPIELEVDAIDPVSEHFKVLDRQNDIIATARLLPDGHIGRMCVRKDRRGEGIGSALLGFIIEFAASTGQHLLRLNAQTSALHFYQRFGFIAQGDIFSEAGIDHQHMVLNRDN